jgi:hypothetical protein
VVKLNTCRPTIHNALGIPEPDDSHRVETQAMWIKLHNPCIEFKHKAGVISGPGTKCRRFKVTKNDTEAIYQACKNQEYTVTRATSAATALTLTRSKTGGTGTYSNFLAFDY